MGVNQPDTAKPVGAQGVGVSERGTAKAVGAYVGVSKLDAAKAVGAHVGVSERGAAKAAGGHVGVSKLDAAILRTQAKAALVGLGWKSAIAGAAVADAAVALGDELVLERLIFEALRRCPRPVA